MTFLASEPPVASMSGSVFDVVAMVASEGGLNALTVILSALPADFPTPILIVQHRAPNRLSQLSAFLDRRSALRVKDAEHREPLQAGTAYLAPADRHLVLGADRALRLDDGPRVNHLRPAADPLFASLAAACGERVIAVVLTGNRNDGARGARAIKRAGGRVLAQDEASSERFDMPGATIATGCVDFVLPLARIPSALVTLTMVPGAHALFKVPLPWWTSLAV